MERYRKNRRENVGEIKTKKKRENESGSVEENVNKKRERKIWRKR